MKKTDTISVLICVHSQDSWHDDLLRAALISLSNQSFQEFQTVIVLDECWGSTEEVLSDFISKLNITYWEKPKKEGLAKAKNFGLKHCTGDWIAFLDADDEYLPCKLEWQRNFLLNNPSIDICGTLAWDRVGSYMKPSCFVPGQYETHEQISGRLPAENCMCHGSVMIRRSALDAVGGYPEDKKYLGKEDWCVWMNLLEAGYKFHNLPERLYVWSANTSVER